MIDPKLALAVAAATANDGGGTFEASTGLPFRPTVGYSVALCDGTAAYVNRADQLAETGHRVAQEWGASYFGTWLDGGAVHVDPVEYVVDLDRAIALGRKRGQLAIYSFVDNDVIVIEPEVQA